MLEGVQQWVGEHGGERTENGGVADTPLERQREGKRGSGVERERERKAKGEENGDLLLFDI